MADLRFSIKATYYSTEPILKRGCNEKVFASARGNLDRGRFCLGAGSRASAQKHPKRQHSNCAKPRRGTGESSDCRPKLLDRRRRRVERRRLERTRNLAHSSRPPRRQDFLAPAQRSGGGRQIAEQGQGNLAV